MGRSRCATGERRRWWWACTSTSTTGGCGPRPPRCSGGAHLIATNDDATYPTAAGPIPGGGAILAAVERATGARATVAGKPHAPMADLVRARLGPHGVMVGDRPETDGAFAVALAYRFALVLTGVISSGEGVEPRPDVVAPDLATAVDRLLA